MPGEQPRPPEAVAAEAQVLQDLGVSADYAQYVAGLPDATLADEVVAPWNDSTPADVLTGLMQQGPELPVIEEGGNVKRFRAHPADYPEHVAMVHRLAGHLGLKVVQGGDK